MNTKTVTVYTWDDIRDAILQKLGAMDEPTMPPMMPLSEELDPSNYKIYADRWIAVREYVLNATCTANVVYIIYPIKQKYLKDWLIEKTGTWMLFFIEAYNQVLEELDPNNNGVYFEL